MACGVIPPGRDLDWLRSQLHEKKEWRLLGIDGINDLANLGSMIRTSSVLGIDAILISHDCCDPWYRRTIRVSMGHVFRIPIIRCPDLALALRQLHETDGVKLLRRYRCNGSVSQHSARTCACSLVCLSCCSCTCSEQLVQLLSVVFRTRFFLLFADCLCVAGVSCWATRTAVSAVPCALPRSAACALIWLPDVDSFNVSIAAAILMHDLRESEAARLPQQQQQLLSEPPALTDSAAGAAAAAAGADVALAVADDGGLSGIEGP